VKLEQRLRRLTPRERHEIISMLKEMLEKDEAVVFAYLHGSFVEGSSVRDVDIAVWLRSGADPLDYIVSRSLEMEQRLGLPVDIQVLNEAPIPFRYVVYTRGRLLTVKDEKLHDLQVAKTLLMYSDLKALRRKALGRPP